MSTSPWSIYRPSAAAPWTLARAWTLRRRAGFGATWRELERDLAGGPGPAVDRVLSAHCRLDGVPQDFEATAALLGDSASASSDPRRLEAWWLYRAYFTPDPLGERLTLAWHDHFATSQLKVDDLSAMRVQNDTFKKLGRGPFGDLLRAMLRDPALLVWLDAPSNRKAKPNENLARELMELFTLGVGRFTESDVKECARALTGLSVVQGHAHFKPPDHDEREKTILGRTARFDAESLAAQLLAQPAAADRLAWRLCATFLGEGVCDESARAGLADLLRNDGLHIGRGVETVLRSEALLLGKEFAHADFRPGWIRHRISASARALRTSAFHAAARRVDCEAGPEAFLPAQCRRLAGWAAMALGARDYRSRQLRGGARTWQAGGRGNRS